MKITNRLTEELQRIASTKLNLLLVPLNNNKRPLGDAWQNRPFSATQLIEAIENGGVNIPIKGKIKQIQPQGFGLLTGHPIIQNNKTYYLMAVDQDGSSAIDKIQELSGGQHLPKTVAFTSQRPGRCQYLFLVPEQYKDIIRTKKIKTGKNDNDNKPEQLEFRWTNLQSVLPPSTHPITGQYHWISGCAIDETKIAVAPKWILEQMLINFCLNKEQLPLTETACVISEENLHNTNFQLLKHPNLIQIPVPSPIPLLECCRKEVREWIATGVQKGHGRNDVAINVGLELVAVEQHLQNIGQSFSDSARLLFSEFCRKSKMTDKEDENRWKWCKAKNPNSSCGDEGIKACIRGWYWREIVKPQINNIDRKSMTSCFKKEHDEDNQLYLKYNQTAKNLMIEQIDEILLNKKLTESQQDLELIKLAKNSNNFNAKEIRTIASKRLSEFEREDNIIERQQELEQLESIDSKEYLPFKDIFYSSSKTVEIFEQLCQINRKIQPQFFLTILSIFSSIIGIKSSLFVKNFGNFHSTINVATVGESGEGKSIVSSILLDPLYQLQNERLNIHKIETRQFNQAISLWDKQHPDVRGAKPKVDDYIKTSDAFMVINEYSREGIVKNHADNPNGLLIHQEELVAIQRAQNMYRQGKGDDRQFLNNLYDNKAIVRSLKSERIIVEKTAVSITGGYQPDIILKEMGDLSDPDGQWARFNFCVGTEKHVFTNLDQPKIDVFPLLYELYKKALNAPEIQCNLDKSGQELLQIFINEMEEKRWHTLQPGWRAVLSKAGAEVCRIALGLHWINCLINDQPVTNIIPIIAIKKAIKIKRYFLSQMQIIRTWGNADPNREDSLAPVYRQVMKIGKRIQGKAKYLTVRMVQSTRSGVFRNMKAPDINKIFKDLADMGKAKLVTYKRSLALIIDSMFDEEKSNQPMKSTMVSSSNDDTIVDFSQSTLNLLSTVDNKIYSGQQKKANYSQAFNSFVGTVGIVAGAFSPLSNLPFIFQTDATVPTIPTIPTIKQNFNLFEFQENLMSAQQSQKTCTEKKPEKLQVNDEVNRLVKLLTCWETTDEPEFITQEELLTYTNELGPKINDYYHQLKAACPNFEKRWWNAIVRMSKLIQKKQEPTLEELKAKLLMCTMWVQLKKIREHHTEQIDKIFKSSKFQGKPTKLQVDNATATVSYDIYRYVGESKKQQTTILDPGAFVFIDSKIKKPYQYISVWLLEELRENWKQKFFVRLEDLEFVESRNF